MTQYHLILASTSPYRAELLNKLNLPYQAIAPLCDETPHSNETAQQLVERLSIGKARGCNLPNQESLVIGSDQVCVVNGEIIGKPLTEAKAVEQLMAQRGQCITFYTGVALHNSKNDKTEVVTDTFNVHFRHYTQEEAEYYVKVEQPLWCAGSFKAEGLGIALFEKLEGDDPNTLIGLPLIKLIKMLENQRVNVLAEDSGLAHHTR